MRLLRRDQTTLVVIVSLRRAHVQALEILRHGLQRIQVLLAVVHRRDKRLEEKFASVWSVLRLPLMVHARDYIVILRRVVEDFALFCLYR